MASSLALGGLPMQMASSLVITTVLLFVTHEQGFCHIGEVGAALVDKGVVERRLVAVFAPVPDDKAIACMELGAAIVINGWKPALDNALDRLLEMCPQGHSLCSGADTPGSTGDAVSLARFGR